MLRPINLFLALILILLFPACANLKTGEPVSCSKEDDDCEVFDFAAASESALRSNGSEIEVQ